MKRNLKNDMQSMYAQLGIKFNLSENAIHRRLRQLMGEERYEAFIVDYGEDAVPEIKYDHLQTADELHTLRSLDAKGMLETNAFQYNQLLPYLKPNTSAVDLGCSTGEFEAWLAQQHPDCSFIGIDRNPRAIQVAKQLVTASNVEFFEFDYSQGAPAPIAPCDLAVSSFGIELHLSDEDGHVSLDMDDLRNCDYYRTRHQAYIPYMTSWRQLIKPDQPLFVVLRLPNIEDALAFTSAAHDAGWSVALSDAGHVRADDERFLALKLLATKGPAPSQSEVIGLFAGDDIKTQIGKPYRGSLAIVVFESLGPKHRLKTDHKVFPDGHTLRQEIGTAGALGYRFTRGTTGFAQLELVPVSLASTLAIDFSPILMSA